MVYAASVIGKYKLHGFVEDAWNLVVHILLDLNVNRKRGILQCQTVISGGVHLENL